MKIIFFDTETTGNMDRDRLCQLAILERGAKAPVVNATYKPALPISIEAMAIHHITEKMVADRPAFTEAEEYATLKDLFEHPETVAIAHNATFDVGMLRREDIAPARVICTYKVATALDPEEKMGGYRLQYLRYLFGLEVEAIAHDAMGDVRVLEAVFEKLLEMMIENMGSEEMALEEMLAISARPLLFSTIRFGKYKGKRIEEIARTDRAYLQWLLKEKKNNPAGETDWIHTLEHFLARS